MNKTLFLTLLIAASSFFLGACKHRKEQCAPCCGKSVIAVPANQYGYQPNYK
jgi:hypothetical protein